ncbi:cyclic lactone autoinducer peptide [Ruminiclostridium herbifermentans]|uniref:Cyclic lactone autoinducer peptide n=1 Tax=Ruminiclostridium herbifermentans TaxID=2488810 RepID=A0A4U7JGW8_9FIRM|nr:cyclic lactone autoinducer peptide [Ruminiclostridium herbifermentans]QNU67233.1 cyclic lactone autoinducer peptide [Ruminiclostridium herbifermentans]
MKKNIKLLVLTALVALGTFTAYTSANACWLFGFHQKECPKTLIKRD